MELDSVLTRAPAPKVALPMMIPNIEIGKESTPLPFHFFLSREKRLPFLLFRRLQRNSSTGYMCGNGSMKEKKFQKVPPLRTCSFNPTQSKVLGNGPSVQSLSMASNK